MKKTIISIFLLLNIIISQNCGAIEDSVRKVDLQQAINVAVENNLDLMTSKLNINIAQNAIKQANRLNNPSINTFFNYGAAGWSEPQQIGASELIEIGKRGPRKQLAKANLELVNRYVKFNKFKLKMDVREAYVKLVAAKSILYTLKQQQSLQENLLSIAKKRYKANLVPEIDVIQAEIALNQMITQVNSADVDVKTALNNFNKVINDKNKIVYDSVDKIFAEENNFEELLTPDPQREMPTFDEIDERALANRFDIKIAKNQVDIAHKNLIVVARQRVPDIEIIGGWLYQKANHTDDNRFNGGAYAGANLVNIPLFYNYSPEIKNAKLALEQANLNYTSVENKALIDLHSAYDRFLTARVNLNHYEKKILTDSEELINVSTKSYETGKSDITSLIVMKQSYRSIIIGYTQALAEYYNSWTNFLREVNDQEFDLYVDEDL